MSHSVFDPTFTKGYRNEVWNSAFIYAGAEGQLRDYISWDAAGDYFFAGTQINDMSVRANLRLNLYPFRRAKKSPLSLGAHFETSLREPDFY